MQEMQSVEFEKECMRACQRAVFNACPEATEAFVNNTSPGWQQFRQFLANKVQEAITDSM
jgi:hypothetical protein